MYQVGEVYTASLKSVFSQGPGPGPFLAHSSGESYGTDAVIRALYFFFSFSLLSLACGLG